MKKEQSNVLENLNGPPVDFSFKNIRSLNELLEETKEKDPIILHEELEKKEQPLKKTNGEKINGEEETAENSTVQNTYETKLEIVRTIEISETKILDANKNGTKKKEKNEKKPLKIVESKSSALFLRYHLIIEKRYNKLTSIEGLYGIVEKIFPNVNNLIWIDLSFNRLVELVDDFAIFPNLKNIYLHSNYIYDFKEIEKLAKVKQLRSLTIHANPLEKYEEFRVLICCIIPQLNKIDSTLLTKREKDRGEVLKGQFKKYPVIKNPQQRPEESDNEEEA